MPKPFAGAKRVALSIKIKPEHRQALEATAAYHKMSLTQVVEQLIAENLQYTLPPQEFPTGWSPITEILKVAGDA